MLHHERPGSFRLLFHALLGIVAAALTPCPVAWTASLPPVEAAHGMVVSAQRLASAVGVEILRRGGNAVDAAVAVGYALAVVHPCCGNLGGGGFMLIHLAGGKDIVLDFRETAPLAATRDMYLDASGNVMPAASTRGYKAVGVPGTVLGLDTALKRYGSMDRAAVMAPAIALAEQGFTLSAPDSDILSTGTKGFAREPNVAAIFLKEGKPLAAGERLVQQDLAETLKLIARQGPDAFYRGSIAEAIVAASNAGGGVLKLEDFRRYQVIERNPVHCSYHGYGIVSTPPPSSGGTTLCEILNIIEGLPLAAEGYHSAASTHDMVEAMRRAYLDRNNRLGDPAFVSNPVSELVSQDYGAKLRAGIDPGHATPSSALQSSIGQEGSQTTHYAVIDSAGNAVGVTYTINSYFGAKVIAGRTGFFLNDEMDDFTAKPGSANMFGLVQGAANAIAPGKRPLSSMSPTLLTKDGRAFLLLGSPGGPRIITAILEVIANVVDFGMDLQSAVDAPRFHHQWLPDQTYTEPFTFSADTTAKLDQMGHKISVQEPWGAVEAILVAPPAAAPASGSEIDDSTHRGALIPGHLYGANDSRRPGGAALGY
jgi:gamma-glutamyltranspeptidase / glutathione hydrolase